VALRHGLGDYPGLIAEAFLTSRLLPVGSPISSQGQPIVKPQDCLSYPLLQDADRADWPLWLRALGIRVAKDRATRGPSFTDDLLAIRAAVAGQGIALVRDVYVAEELAAGRLIVALDRPWPTLFSYYFVTRPEAQRQSKVAAFRAWVRGEAGQSSYFPC
jgi:LysR family glycine cleavage system transcriptional activator